MATADFVAGALVANTVASVTVHSGLDGVWVINRSTTNDEIWVRLDGVDPAVGVGYLVLGARNFPTPDGHDTNVRMISTGTPGYSVEGAVPVA